MKKLVALAFLLSVSQYSIAQEKLEEVIVTAQKRVEDKSDVPRSLTVLSNQFIDKMGIKKIEDLVAYTDNVQYTESGLSTQVRIRGIGSGNSQGFEQSVGQYSDGVYYGRAQLFRAPIFDVERVEILRGSQNALFGKDSIAGAIVVNTAEPTKIPTGKITLGYNPEFDQKLEVLSVSGALTENINARLSLRGLQEKGYFENTTLNEKGPGRREDAVRLKIDWTATDKLLVKIKFEKSNFDVEGRPFEIVQDTPSNLTLDLIAKMPGNATLKSIPSTYSNISTVILKQPGFDANTDYKRQASLNEFSDNIIHNFTMDAIYDFGDVTWHSKIARIGYKYNELCECDYVPASIFTLALDERYSQTSVDSFIQNSADESLQWTLGAYYQQADLDFHDLLFVPADSALKSLGIPIANTGINRIFSQNEDVFALYGQTKISLTERMTLAVEGRYSYNEKKAERTLNIVDKDNNPYSNPGITCTYLSLFKVDTVQSFGFPNDCRSASPNLAKGISAGNDKEGDKTEFSFTPALTLNYKFNNLNSGFISVRSGHKSGGFDPRSNSSVSFEFDEETSLTEEIGLRSLSDDGKLENGVTVFHTVYDNLQVSQFDGIVGFNVGNAKKTASNGVEFDGRYLLTDNIKLNYSAGYIDIAYKDFKNGNCYQGQIPDGTDINGDGKPDLCDYSGKKVGFTPSHTINIGAEYNQDLSSANVIYAINVERVGKQNVHENLDPNGEQDAYYMLNANITFKLDNFAVSIIGNNLTNEYVKTYAANVPLSGSTFGTNTMYSFSKRPRSVSINLDYTF